MTHKCLKCLKDGATIHAKNIWLELEGRKCDDWFHKECFKDEVKRGNWIIMEDRI